MLFLLIRKSRSEVSGGRQRNECVEFWVDFFISIVSLVILMSLGQRASY